jgi:hypothetical protein
MPVAKPRFELSDEYTQLALGLELPEVELEGVSVEEARLRSEAARGKFENAGFEWRAEYLELRNGGWPWRQAAYIAWAASPKGKRNPKTQDDLAQKVLGLTSDRAISTWRKRNPMIDEMVAMLQSAPLFEYRAEIYRALVANAIQPDYKTHNDRKLALEMLGDYIPASKLTAELLKSLKGGSLDDLSDEELVNLSSALASKMAKDDPAPEDK